MRMSHYPFVAIASFERGKRPRGAQSSLACTIATVAFLIATAMGARASGMCGMSPQDWCPAPAGDVCNAHRDAVSCRGDPRCTAMPYRGESVIACIYDARGFPTNCPVVGCISIENRGKP